jgi:hypothetical protein
MASLAPSAAIASAAAFPNPLLDAVTTATLSLIFKSIKTSY